MKHLYSNIIKFLDRLICLCISPILIVWYNVYKKIYASPAIDKNIKNILFLGCGQPLQYPQDKIHDHKVRAAWNSALTTQLNHPTFNFTYILYLGSINSCYKLCPNVVAVIIKKHKFFGLTRLAAMFNTLKLILASAKLHQTCNFYTVETFLPGDRLLAAKFISKIIKRPLVIQCQGDFDLSFFDEDPNNESFKKLISRNIQKMLFSIVLRHAKIVLGYNDHCASFAICNGASPQKVRRCRIHSSIEDFENLESSKAFMQDSLREHDFVFLWCRLAPEKKLIHCFEAMKQVFKQNSQVKLVIAGHGPLRVHFEQQFIGFEKNVHFLGNLELHELKSYIDHSRICLVPLGGHSLIEAGVCKKPVIGFNWEWHGEVITNNESGILVDYPNVEDFSNAVIWLLNNPEQATKMGEKLHKRIWKLFNQDYVMQREIKIWNDFHRELGMTQ